MDHVLDPCEVGVPHGRHAIFPPFIDPQKLSARQLTIADVRAWIIEMYNDPEDRYVPGDWDREYRWMVSEGLQYLNRR